VDKVEKMAVVPSATRHRNGQKLFIHLLDLNF